MSKSVATIIVTYNRLDLLKESLENMFKQDVIPNEVFVVDNACTDGTTEYLKNQTDYNISVIHMEANLGGAGGFNVGLKSAYSKGHDYFWLMDDDTICHQDTLKNLLEALEFLNKNQKIGYVCSEVLWTDGALCKMNIPKISKNFGLNCNKGIIKVDRATFVSILFTRQAILECGFPIKEFFIWADDSEYTLRINEKFDNYLVSKSKVTHKMGVNLEANIVKDTNRLERYLYAYRNRYYIRKKQGFKALIKYYMHLLYTMINILRISEAYRFKKINIIIKGTYRGINFNPIIEYPHTIKD